MDAYVKLRNGVIHAAYGGVLKPIFFKQDPEAVHNQVGLAGARLGNMRITRALTSLLFNYTNPVLRQRIHGIDFNNPIGLAAGFDKNARLTSILPHVGFGWMEVGSITARPCKGNPGKRLHRLPESKSLLVNYGLMNDGSDRIYERLHGRHFSLPVGTSLAPTNDESTMDYRDAIKDYVYSCTKLAEVGSYTTLNLSCPNTCNDQPFTDPRKLDELLSAIEKVKTRKPIFLKLSPDLSMDKLDSLLTVAKKHGVAGVICANLTKNHSHPLVKEQNLPEKGGFSGKVVKQQSDEMIAHVFRRWGTTFTIVGCGGVFTAQDAYRKIRLGASLIQLITGMIYEGPQVISSINQGLAELLKTDRFSSISEAVGKDIGQ
ncbi:MAG: quinone-dependent dihydroorotate dehydrogenase [bacterium]